MDIKTKYNLGDKVWVIQHSRAVSYTINGVHSHKFLASDGKAYTRNLYDIGVSGGINIQYTFPEDECFPTKEELIKSL